MPPEARLINRQRPVLVTYLRVTGMHFTSVAGFSSGNISLREHGTMNSYEGVSLMCHVHTVTRARNLGEEKVGPTKTASMRGILAGSYGPRFPLVSSQLSA